MTPKSLEDAGAQEAALLEVAVALPLFHTLTYRVPPRLISAQVGCLVKVPVGRRHTSGYLLGPAREIPEAALKDVSAIMLGAVCSPCPHGSITQTMVPTPSLERSFIDPPCRLASDLAIASPRPEPW